MRRDHLLTFDEMISAAAGPAQVYTAASFNQRLAMHNQIGFQVVIDNVTGSPAFDLWVEHSPDGRIWLQHSDTAQTFPPPATAGTGDISFATASLAAGNTYTRMYSNAVLGIGKVGTAASGPLLSNVRLSMKLSTGAAHVKVYAVLRNP
jgi:hypothetical protein